MRQPHDERRRKGQRALVTTLIALSCCRVALAARPPEPTLVLSAGLHHQVAESATGYAVGLARPVLANDRISAAVQIDYTETRQTERRDVSNGGETIRTDDRVIRRSLPVSAGIRVSTGSNPGNVRPYLLASLGWHRAWSAHSSSVGEASRSFQGPFYGVGAGAMYGRFALQVEWRDGPQDEKTDTAVAAPPQEGFSPRAVLVRVAWVF